MKQDDVIILSSPKDILNEHQILLPLFQHGLKHFHLRKPDFSDLDYASYLSKIPFEYWSRIVLHYHHHLAEQLGLGGVHLKERDRKGKTGSELLEMIQNFQLEGLRVSAAIHRLEELDFLGNVCDYALISPVFDSISKPNYLGNPDLNVQQRKVKAKLFAMGGITKENAALALQKGFDGIAVLGYIWSKSGDETKRLERLFQT